MEKWEIVTDESYERTDRLKVDGGYLYRTRRCLEEEVGAMAYVPAIDLTRYQAHLRDAYNQGYADGRDDTRNAVERDSDVTE